MNIQNKENSSEDSIKLKDLVAIFLRRKWFFVIFFLVTLVIGLLFTFIKTPLYQSYSVLKLKGVHYDENLYKYFPDEAKKLGILAPELDTKELEDSVLKDITVSIREDELLEKVSGKLNFQVNKEELNQAINNFVDSSNKVIRVLVTYNNPEAAYQINNNLIDTYLESNKNEISEIIDDVLLEIDKRIASLQAQYEEVDSGNGAAKDSTAVPESTISIITDLDKIKYNLENNRDTYINNIEILKEPFVPSEAINMDNLKSILLTIFSAVAVGLIAVYIPCVFTSFKE